MIKFTTLGHICIIVDEIEEAAKFYEGLFGAIPFQNFPKLKNAGFAKAAGFLKNPNEVEVTIRFLKLPTQDNIVIELMEYHNPPGKFVQNNKETTDKNLVAHIALRVTNIEEAFEHLKTVAGVRMINNSPDYRPYKIDMINTSEFYFYDKNLENNETEKNKVCNIIGNIKYLYFVDKYGVQWELEQGHSDIGSEI